MYCLFNFLVFFFAVADGGMYCLFILFYFYFYFAVADGGSQGLYNF